MTDLSKTIQPKSDQLNYDDFIGGESRTITITDVNLAAGDQPIAIHYQGDNGKPWKPGKSMRRVLVMVWGSDGSTYKGRQLTLYGDPNVKFGGSKVGGIRISHMSHINQEVALPLTASRSVRVPFIVKPLIVTKKYEIEPLREAGLAAAVNGVEALKTWWMELGSEKQKSLGVAYLEEMKKIAEVKKE